MCNLTCLQVDVLAACRGFAPYVNEPVAHIPFLTMLLGPGRDGETDDGVSFLWYLKVSTAGLTIPDHRGPLVGVISALAARAAALEQGSEHAVVGSSAAAPLVEAARLLQGMNARAPRRIEGDDFDAQVCSCRRSFLGLHFMECAGRSNCRACYRGQHASCKVEQVA